MVEYSEIPNLENLFIVSEEWIKYSCIEASKVIEKEEDNEYIKMLDAGNQYREAGLTPLYLFNKENQSLFVTANEYCSMRLH